MGTYTNTKEEAVKVQYKIAGKTYNNNTQESTAVDTAESTFYPFDEVVVAPGATVELGDATVLDVVDGLGKDVDLSQVQPGDDKPITNAPDVQPDGSPLPESYKDFQDGGTQSS